MLNSFNCSQSEMVVGQVRPGLGWIGLDLIFQFLEDGLSQGFGIVLVGFRQVVKS